MARPTTEQLITMALATLEEVAALSRHHVQPQTRGVAFSLAYLAHVSPAKDRWFFDEFWRAMRCDCGVSRPARLNAALTAIHEALSRRREIEVVSAFQRAANEKHGAPAGYPA